MRIINKSGGFGAGGNASARTPQKGEMYYFDSEASALNRFPDSKPIKKYGAWVVTIR